jgi:sugar lactone lactonase YvrE
MNFYPPPEVVTALVYYDVPESLRCRARSTEWSRGFYHGLDGVFLEGPCFDNDGDLYVVDVAFGRIVKINQAKQGSVALEWDGEPNGLALMPNGRIMVADYKQVTASSIGEFGRKEPADLILAGTP